MPRVFLTNRLKALIVYFNFPLTPKADCKVLYTVESATQNEVGTHHNLMSQHAPAESYRSKWFETMPPHVPVPSQSCVHLPSA